MNKETKELMLIGEFRDVATKLSDVLGEKIGVTLSDKAYKKLKLLEKEYNAFYELSIEERLVKSGMNKPKEDKSL